MTIEIFCPDCTAYILYADDSVATAGTPKLTEQAHRGIWGLLGPTDDVTECAGCDNMTGPGAELELVAGY